MAATLLIRADAGPQVGTGHLMRALALAEAWQTAGGRVIFATCCRPEPLRRRIRAAGAGLILLEHPHPDPADLACTLALLAEAESDSEHAAAGPTWVALDGYQFDTAYQRAIRAAGGRLLLIDDLSRPTRCHAHALLNQNLGAERLGYACDCDTVLLLGCRYALLRQQFHAWWPFQRQVARTAQKLLVTLGGADPDNVTGTAVAALAQLDLPHLEAKVVVGAANPHLDALRQQARRLPGSIEILTGVADMPKLMAWADVALSAAGITCWELAFMQLPALLVAIVDVQQPIAEQIAEARAATNLGRADRLTAEALAGALWDLCRSRSRRAAQARAGRRLVDGRGADRVVAIVQALSGTLPQRQIELRRATPDDDVRLWSLANDAAVRQTSCTSAEPIPLASHVRWFRRRLASPGSRIWVLDFHGLILGQIRYDKTDTHTAEISISVAGPFRRCGLATRLLDATWSQACRQLQVRRLRANIRQENLPSLKTFTRAGFTKVSSPTFHGHPCHVFEQQVGPAAGGRGTQTRP